MAGRKRNSENEWLPPKVQKDKYGYRYFNRSTNELIRLKDERGNIIRHDASKSAVWNAYERLCQDTTYNFKTVVMYYFQSPAFQSLASLTQRDYINYSKNINYSFGEMLPEEIKSTHVRIYMDARGKDYPTAANREKSFLSLVYNWGLERGYIIDSSVNPCISVKNLKIKKTNRYVEDSNLNAFYNFLIENGNIAHAAAMMIAYNCAARQQDILRLLEHKPFVERDEDCYITDEYIRIYQHKTGRVQNKLLNNALISAIKMAKAYKKSISDTGKVCSKALIVTTTGTKFTRDGFNATWLRRQREAEARGIINKRFRFHDLKHKGISDHVGNKKEFSGHATDGMVQRYDHSVPTVPSLKRG